jgi:hypothetical protein
VTLSSLESYSLFIAALVNRRTVLRSTVTVWSDSPYTGIAEAEIFCRRTEARLREELDFEAGLITSYGYEVYRGEERLYWYDDFRIPGSDARLDVPTPQACPAGDQAEPGSAPGLRFDGPNLQVLVSEIDTLS